MKTHSRIYMGAGVLLLLLFSASAQAAAQGPDEAGRARALWEQAVAARGGREQLHRVESLLISYRETVRNFFGVVVHRGDVERLYAFPDRMWGWDDGLPPPFSLTINTLDLGRDRRCTLRKTSAAPLCGPARQGQANPDEGLVQAQLLYLMETRWVKPTPVGVRAGSVGLRKVDVLRARFGDRRIDYFLDRKTHLPARVALYYGAGERPALTVDLSDYAPVGGVLMPGRQKDGRVNFQINPPYDAGVFARTPSIEAGPKAWQRAATATAK